MTSTGMIVGTPSFMSPEQAKDARVGAASDVFSLGCVIAFAAAGQGPFGSGPQASLLYRIVHAEPALDGVPGGLRELAVSCLAKEPADRPGLTALAEAAAAARGPDDDAVLDRFWPAPLAGLIRGHQNRVRKEMRDTRSGQQTAAAAATALRTAPAATVHPPTAHPPSVRPDAVPPAVGEPGLALPDELRPGTELGQAPAGTAVVTAAAATAVPGGGNPVAGPPLPADVVAADSPAGYDGPGSPMSAGGGLAAAAGLRAAESRAHRAGTVPAAGRVRGGRRSGGWPSGGRLAGQPGRFAGLSQPVRRSAPDRPQSRGPAPARRPAQPVPRRRAPRSRCGASAPAASWPESRWPRTGCSRAALMVRSTRSAPRTVPGCGVPHRRAGGVADRGGGWRRLRRQQRQLAVRAAGPAMEPSGGHSAPAAR